jgi:MFS family permease
LALASRTEAIIAILISLGMSCGLATGPILSLPARVLEPETRAIGMGVFFSISYVGLVLGPMLGGKYATWAGNAGAAFDFGAAALLICPIILWVFNVSKAERRLPSNRCLDRTVGWFGGCNPPPKYGAKSASDFSRAVPGAIRAAGSRPQMQVISLSRSRTERRSCRGCAGRKPGEGGRQTGRNRT